MGLRAWAPGRVNLIGDHTDYMGGLVLPMAIGLGTEITGDRGGNWVMLGSDRLRRGGRDPARRGRTTRRRSSRRGPATWPRSSARSGPDDGLVGMVHSTLPAGSGLASSAALEVAVATALGADLADPAGRGREACQRAEQRAVGVPCGIMDQLVSLAAVEGIGPAHRLRHPRPSTRCRSPRTPRSSCIHSGEHRELAGVGLRRAPGPVRGRRGDRRAPARRLARRRRGHRGPRAAAAGPPRDHRERAGRRPGQRRWPRASSPTPASCWWPATPACATTSRSRPRRSTSWWAPVRGVPGVYGARVTGAGFGGCVVALCKPKTRLNDAGRVAAAGPAAGAVAATS